MIKLYPCESRKQLELEEGEIIKDCRNKKLEIVKNECVTITKIDGDNIYFGEKFIPKEDIHKIFMLGYAMTIHKSQGQTIDGILNIHEVREIVQDKRMFYTAVSRATCLENVNYVK